MMQEHLDGAVMAELVRKKLGEDLLAAHCLVLSESLCHISFNPTDLKILISQDAIIRFTSPAMTLAPSALNSAMLMREAPLVLGEGIGHSEGKEGVS